MSKSKIPTYSTDEEVAAAREMYGTSYDKMVAGKAISAPTRETLSDTELRTRLDKVAERKAGKGKKAAKAAKRSTAKRSTAKRSSGKRVAKTDTKPRTESTETTE